MSVSATQKHLFSALKHFCFPQRMQTFALKERWYVGIKVGGTQHKNGPCLYTVMAIWRHSVTTQKCRTSALHCKPHLFRFAFFANIASDHLDAVYILSGYNDGQFVQHGSLSWISYNIRYFVLKSYESWNWQWITAIQPKEYNFKLVSNSPLANSILVKKHCSNVLGNFCGVVTDIVLNLNWVEHKYLGYVFSCLQWPLQPLHLSTFCFQGLSCLVVSEKGAWFGLPEVYGAF